MDPNNFSWKRPDNSRLSFQGGRKTAGLCTSLGRDMPTPPQRRLRSVTQPFIPHLVAGVRVPEQAGDLTWLWERTRQEVTAAPASMTIVQCVRENSGGQIRKNGCSLRYRGLGGLGIKRRLKSRETNRVLRGTITNRV